MLTTSTHNTSLHISLIISKKAFFIFISFIVDKLTPNILFTISSDWITDALFAHSLFLQLVWQLLKLLVSMIFRDIDCFVCLDSIENPRKTKPATKHVRPPVSYIWLVKNKYGHSLQRFIGGSKVIYLAL